MTNSQTSQIDYEAEFKHLRNEVQVLREGFLSVIPHAQALCDNVMRFKVALERVQELEKSAESDGKMSALIEARHVKEKLWEAIMVDAEEVSLRISQLPPGATFIDSDFRQDSGAKETFSEVAPEATPIRRPRP